MNHSKNTTKKPILKYIKVVEHQWNIIKKDPGSTDFTIIKPSCKTEAEVKEALAIMKEKLK
jgi:hypothetical protein